MAIVHVLEVMEDRSVKQLFMVRDWHVRDRRELFYFYLPYIHGCIHLLDMFLLVKCGARCSSAVRAFVDGSSDRSFMVDPLSYFSFQPVLHDWCNKGRGMCYPVCGWCI